MTTSLIHAYPAANSIDAAADYLLIDPASSGVYRKISRNTLLGLASAPLGLTDVQSPTNKVFDNSNSYTIKDGSLALQNSADPTKQAAWSLSGITAGQTRTFTLPDASGTLATIAGTQTLTNKTLTAPVITGGTIDNSTVTVDSIAGHSSATVVTVANLQISNGVLNTANAVTATAIAASAVQPQHLTSGTGSGWAWSSWTPTWTNLTVGNGTLTYAKYIQVGKTVFGRLMFVLGTTSSVSGAIKFSLPVTAHSDYPSGNETVDATVLYNGNLAVGGALIWSSSTQVEARWWAADATVLYEAVTNVSSPFTWSNGCYIQCSFRYEAA